MNTGSKNARTFASIIRIKIVTHYSSSPLLLVLLELGTQQRAMTAPASAVKTYTPIW